MSNLNNISTGQSFDIKSRIDAQRALGYGKVTLPSDNVGNGKVQGKEGKSFSNILTEKVQDLKFSAHAAGRLKSRNIEVTPEIMNKLENAVAGAAAKGARDSLILMKGLAFIVNVPNRTVITAMDGDGVKENIYTNIDSAVITD